MIDMHDWRQTALRSTLLDFVPQSALECNKSLPRGLPMETPHVRSRTHNVYTSKLNPWILETKLG